MRVAIDATAAVAQRAGVGRYARELLRELVQLSPDDRFSLMIAGTDLDASTYIDTLPPGAWREHRGLPLPERWTTLAWQRLRLPLPVELLGGSFDLFHGLDFVLPPTRRRSVVTIHDLSYLLYPEFAEPRLSKYLTAAVPRTLRRANAVVAVSASVAEALVTAYPFVEGRVVAIPNGVRPPVRERPKSQSAASPVILMVGTVEPRKNHRLLLTMFREVRADVPDARLVIVGRLGWRAEEIAAEIQEAERQGGVSWLRNASDADIESCYAEATLAVYPSWYEGFGLPVIEAMARGVPVVTSDLPALRETGGDAALYAAPDQSSDFAAHVLSLLNDAERRTRCRQAGLARARLFPWRTTAERVRRVYRRVLDGEFR